MPAPGSSVRCDATAAHAASPAEAQLLQALPPGWIAEQSAEGSPSFHVFRMRQSGQIGFRTFLKFQEAKKICFWDVDADTGNSSGGQLRRVPQGAGKHVRDRGSSKGRSAYSQSERTSPP